MILSRAGRLYLWLCCLAMTILIALVLANGAFYLALQFKEHFKSLLASSNPVGEKYGASLRLAYPDMTMTAINDLLVETWTRQFDYDPVVQFREGTFDGRYVKVDGAGFRHSADQGAWPPNQANYNIFVFGSSVTFGYGMPDDQTVTSHLQQRLGEVQGRKVRVYNFGRGLYFSTQERRLFERLLLTGYVPDAAIFIDGLSEFSRSNNELPYTQQLSDALKSGSLSHVMKIFQEMPLQRLAKWFRHRIVPRLKADASQSPQKTIAETTGQDEKSFDPLPSIQRYFLNAKLIKTLAEDYGVDFAFIWHPTADYRAEPGAVPLRKVDPFENLDLGKAYELARGSLENHPAGDHFIWCADIQIGITEPLYVDAMHYNARAASLFSSCIANTARDRGLLSKR